MIGKLFRRNSDVNFNLPKITVGRYSDNNKSLIQMRLWDNAERLFKEGKFIESLKEFFTYLKDETIDNVLFENTESEFKFEIIQGSKIVRGIGNSKNLHAAVSMVKMAELSVPVMRRLLENNFKLFYSKYALNNDLLLMKFDSEIDSANPNKLYYALKELAVASNRQSYLLIKDFPLLGRVESEHNLNINTEEGKIKISFMRIWIEEAFDKIEKFDANKNANGISLILLNLIYSLDYFLCPHGNLAIELNRIQEINQRKDMPSQMQKNRLMKEGIETIKITGADEILKSLTIEISTFSIRQPKTISIVEENIREANKKMDWYKSNGYYDISNIIAVYGFSVSNYLYSLPQPLIELFKIFMEINYSKFFFAFYDVYNFYDPVRQHFYILRIENSINKIEKYWKPKYNHFNFPVEKLEYNNLLAFNLSFTQIVSSINLDL